MSAIGDAVRAVGRLFSPQPARPQAPEVERAHGFPEASPSPQDTKIFSQGAQPDWSLEQGWDRRYTVDRAQQMHRSNLLAGSILDRSADHVIGPGYRLQPATGDKGFNREARLAWEEWASRPAYCDVRARANYWEMARECYVGEQRDGDSGMLMMDDGSGEGKIRVVNSIEIASPVGGYYKTTDVDGVERDLNGKHLAYWIHEPDEIAYSDVRAALHRLMRVPAKDFVFWARTPLGAQQTRGITAFLGTFTLLEQVDGTILAISKKAQIAARYAMVITKKSPLPQARFGGPANKRQLTRIEDGQLTRLELDEDIKPVQSMDPNANLIDLIKILVRICGTRFCLSLATITLDHSDHNFSNARASAIELNKGTEIRQKRVAQNTSSVYEMKMLEFIRRGRLKVSALKRREREINFLKHAWYYPARPLIDPLTETQADLLGLDVGTGTWEEIAARKGMTAMQLFRRQERERDTRTRLKLPDVRSSFSRESVETIVTQTGTGGKKGSGKKKGGDED